MDTEAVKRAKAKYKTKMKSLQCYISPEEHAAIKEAAARHGMSIARYLVGASEHYDRYLAEQEQQQ